MIFTTKPYGSFSDSKLKATFSQNNKYYVVDTVGNRYETTKKEFNRCRCIIKSGR